jgi:uncharacterized damage-inducible protein DinB
VDVLDRLLDHDRWATAQLLDLSRGLRDADLDREFDVGLRTLRATLEHMTFYVAYWTAYMAGEPVAEPRNDCTLAALVDRHERTYPDFAALARRLRDEGRLDETFADHDGARVSCGATILHVVLHNAQHRSEARHVLERLGLPDVADADPQEWEWAHAPAGR